MTSSSPAPKLPIWIFFVVDAALIGAAFYIGSHAARPWSEMAILGVMACVILGAFIVFVPVTAHYERVKNEMLDDRQRAIEALARTVTSSAEQISIAAAGLHEIAELAQRNLRHAEQLPHKLQEKIAEFQAQMANATDAEREELEKELEELRASESERLQSASDKIAKTAAELARLEATSNQHLTAANEAVAKLSFSAASAIGKAQAAAEQAFAHSRQDASRAIAEATQEAVKGIAAAKAAALDDFRQHFEASLQQLRVAGAGLDATVERFRAAASTVSLPPAPASRTSGVSAASETSAEPPPSFEPVSPSPRSTPAPLDAAAPVEGDTPAPVEADSLSAPAAATEPAPPSARRTRKSRREESAVAGSRLEKTDHPDSPPSSATETGATPAAADAATAETSVPSPASAGSATSAADGSAPLGDETTGSPAPGGSARLDIPHPPEKPARKRAVRKPDEDQPGLGLDLGDAPANGTETEDEGAGATVESVLSSDGATRLVVTAYIGIGNRLFIRGEGPGLTWEKGTPLQFVSIGKWRWETSDASGPVRCKLLKNDEQECTGLGSLTIEPGHQQEVTASF